MKKIIIRSQFLSFKNLEVPLSTRTCWCDGSLAKQSAGALQIPMDMVDNEGAV